MIGVLAFVAAGVIMVGLVLLRSRLDRGAGERRALRGAEVSVWEWFARFEARGGRVQELDALASAGGARRASVVWQATSQVVVALALVTGAFALGWSLWIPLTGVLVLNVVASLAGEYLVYLANPLAESWRYARAVPLLAVGVMTKGILFCSGLAVLWLGASALANGRFIEATVCVIGGVAIIDKGHLVSRAIESSIRARLQVVFADDATYSTILYLRSFDDDTGRVYAPLAQYGWYAPLLPQRARFEELVEGWTFGQAEQVVAIGRPGEPRPALGAQRTYWTDETWQEAVRHTAARCRAIILVAGTSEGLAWEIEQLARMGVLGKTLLLLPPDTEENSRLRYERITQATGRGGDVLVDDPDLLPTVPALGFTPDGELIHYVACGRDWVSYVVAELHLLNTLSGLGRFESAGNLSRTIALTEDPVLQARWLVMQRAEHALARDVLDTAWTASQSGAPSEAAPERLAIARAAVLLAEGGPPAQTLAELRRDAVHVGVDDSELVRLARHRLGEPSVSAARLFELVVPDEWRTSGTRRTEKPGLRARVAYQSLFARLAEQAEQDDGEGALRITRELRELGVASGLELVVATADALAAQVLSALERLEEARALAVDVIDRDLPWRLKDTQSAMTTTAVEVRDMAVDVLLENLDSESDQDHAERVRLLERQRGWRLDGGLRKEAAETAQQIASCHANAGEWASARTWAETARGEFAGLGLPAGQVEALTILARADLGTGDWDEAMASSGSALALADPNGFDDLRGNALYAHALATHRNAKASDEQTDWQAVVRASEACLRHGERSGFPGTRQDDLLCQLVDAHHGLGRKQDHAEAQRRLVAHRVAAHGLDDVRTLRARLMLARVRRDLGEHTQAREEVDRILVALDRQDRTKDRRLRAESLLTLADLAEKSGDLERALETLAQREVEIASTISTVAGVRERSSRVGLLLRADRHAEALAMQQSLVDELTDLAGAEAADTRKAVEDRGALEWEVCLREAGSLRQGGDHRGAAERYQQWLGERSTGGSGDRRRELSCSVRIAGSLSRAGESDDDRMLRDAQCSVVAEYGEADALSQYALAERARAHRRAGRYLEEIACLNELHGIEVAVLGEMSKDAVGTLSWLAQAHRDAGNAAEATRHANLALGMCLAQWGAGDPFTEQIRETVEGLTTV